LSSSNLSDTKQDENNAKENNIELIQDISHTEDSNAIEKQTSFNLTRVDKFVS
jgi:hypothetical protein